MKKLNNLLRKIKELRKQQWMWLLYPITSIIFIGVITWISIQSIGFISYEINRSLTTQEELEGGLLRIELNDFENISQKLHFSTTTKQE